jgi:hypothetical protein
MLSHMAELFCHNSGRIKWLKYVRNWC